MLAPLAVAATGALGPAVAHADLARSGPASTTGAGLTPAATAGASPAIKLGHAGSGAGARALVRLEALRASGGQLRVTVAVSEPAVSRLRVGEIVATVRVTLQRAPARGGLAVIAMPEQLVASRRLHAGRQTLRMRLPGRALAAPSATLRLTVSAPAAAGGPLRAREISARMPVIVTER